MKWTKWGAGESIPYRAKRGPRLCLHEYGEGNAAADGARYYKNSNGCAVPFLDSHYSILHPRRPPSGQNSLPPFLPVHPSTCANKSKPPLFTGGNSSLFASPARRISPPPIRPARWRICHYTSTIPDCPRVTAIPNDFSRWGKSAFRKHSTAPKA